MPFAAGRYSCSLFDAGVDIAGNFVELLLADQRSHRGLRVETGAHVNPAGDVADALENLVIDAFVHEQA